ncbi:MAG: ABC transporter substrate-binding protein [Verrucomicrobiales bacterium]
MIGARSSPHAFARVAACLPAAAAALLLVSCGEDERFPPYDVTDETAQYYQSKPEFFVFASPEDLPGDLVWETGMDLPEIGSPEAKKGGTVNYWIDDFPATIRFVGPDANDSFRSEHWDDLNIYTVMRHPNVDAWMPGLANEWANGSDGRTSYFKLDPKATWSDGTPITTDDFFMTFFVYQSKNINDPWYNNWYGEQYTKITKYDDRTFAVTLKDIRPDPLWYTTLPPLHREFFKEFSDDFPARYQWRKMPTTGAYDIGDAKERKKESKDEKWQPPEKDLRKGQAITMTRVKDWWLKDHKYYKNLFNPDRIHYRVIRNMEKAFESFRTGEVDHFAVSIPEYWHNKLDIPEFHNGYIEKSTFYNIYPRVSRGIYINCSKPVLENRDIRYGIHHAMNVDRVIEIELRGDFERMQSTQAGFGKFTNPDVKPREFSPAKAREYFAKAGFSKVGADGILMNEQGQRLSFRLGIFGGMAIYQQSALRLKQEALKAGLEIVIDAMDGTAFYESVMEKSHDMVIWGWAASPPYPRFWEGFTRTTPLRKTTTRALKSDPTGGGSPSRRPTISPAPPTRRWTS